MAYRTLSSSSDVQPRFRRFVSALGIALLTSPTGEIVPGTTPVILWGTGVPSESVPNGSIAVRLDGANPSEVLYFRQGGAWVAGELDAGTGGFVDSLNFFATDTAAAAFAELATAIGGATSTVRNYSSNVYVADNDALMVAIGKLDAALAAFVANLASTAPGAGAADIGVEDAGGFFPETNLEGVTQRLGSAINDLDGIVFGLAVVGMTAQAEAGNARQVNIQLRDLNGDPYAIAGKVLFELYDPSMLHALVAEWTLAETGGGTELSTTARPSLLVQTNGDGEAIVTVTDVSGVAVTTMRLRATVYNDGPGVPYGLVSQIDLAFA